MRSKFSNWLAAAVLLMIVGCSSEKRVPVFPVTGRVMFEGRPAAGAQVVLHPVNRAEANDVAPTGTVGADGSFTITAYEPGDGAPDGDYVATVQWYRYAQALGGPGPNVIPVKYANPRTSPIKVSVNGAATELQPIVLR